MFTTDNHYSNLLPFPFDFMVFIPAKCSHHEINTKRLYNCDGNESVFPINIFNLTYFNKYWIAVAAQVNLNTIKM